MDRKIILGIIASTLSYEGHCLGAETTLNLSRDPGLMIMETADNTNYCNIPEHQAVTIRTLNLCASPAISDANLRLFTNLTELDLSWHQKYRHKRLITKEGVSYLTSLTSLNLKANDAITDKALPHFTNLTSLSLGDGTTTAGGEILTTFPNLTFLDTGGSFVKEDVLGQLTSLASLRLGNKSTTPAASFLLRLPRLRCLDTGGGFVADETLEQLTNLRSLSLGEHVIPSVPLFESLLSFPYLTTFSLYRWCTDDCLEEIENNFTRLYAVSQMTFLQEFSFNGMVALPRCVASNLEKLNLLTNLVKFNNQDITAENTLRNQLAILQTQWELSYSYYDAQK